MQDVTFLVTTDFHGNRQALNDLAKLLDRKTYDAVIMAGDLINPRQDELPYVYDFIELIKDKHQLPLLGLHGNNEPEEAYAIYREADINIHLQTRQFAGYNICGIGSFGYLNESGFEDLSVENLIINERTIFVTHVPPRRVEPQVHGPLVHLFGHKHVLAFCKQIGPTLQVQCPAGILGKVTELHLPSKTVEFISLNTK